MNYIPFFIVTIKTSVHLPIQEPSFIVVFRNKTTQSTDNEKLLY